MIFDCLSEFWNLTRKIISNDEKANYQFQLDLPVLKMGEEIWKFYSFFCHWPLSQPICILYNGFSSLNLVDVLKALPDEKIIQQTKQRE